MAVGVGSGYNRQTLLDVAGDASRVFEVTDFSALSGVTTGVLQVIQNAGNLLKIIFKNNFSVIATDVFFNFKFPFYC